MVTIGALAKQFKLSRSTLLYYDKIGLLQATGRSAAGYRLYAQGAVERMTQIERYKEAGLSLEAIAEILDSPQTDFSRILEQQLEMLNVEMGRLRRKQRFILQLLGKESILS